MKQPTSKWIVIYMAHSEERAELARELLMGEGFVVQTRPVAKALTSGDNCYEVLVLPSEAKEARDFLGEQFV